MSLLSPADLGPEEGCLSSSLSWQHNSIGKGCFESGFGKEAANCARLLLVFLNLNPGVLDILEGRLPGRSIAGLHVICRRLWSSWTKVLVLLLCFGIYLRSRCALWMGDETVRGQYPPQGGSV